MKTKITRAKAADLLEILTKTAQQKKMPLKFCIARNIKLLQESVGEYIEKKESLFKEVVVIDGSGNGVIKKEFEEISKKLSNRIPYQMFEFESELIEEKFFKELDELNNSEFEIEFIKENAARVIKISNEKGEYENSTIQEVLEDPNNEVTPALVTLFLEYFLEM